MSQIKNDLRQKYFSYYQRERNNGTTKAKSYTEWLENIVLFQCEGISLYDDLFCVRPIPLDEKSQRMVKIIEKFITVSNSLYEPNQTPR